MKTQIQQLQDEITVWSDNTFGSDRPPSAPVNHLAKEVIELIESPEDRMEYADCMMLLLDAYRITGGSADDLVAACYQKLEINKVRKCGVSDKDGVVEHIRT